MIEYIFYNIHNNLQNIIILMIKYYIFIILKVDIINTEIYS